MKLNTQKGYVLASVITLSALVFIIGSSSIYMTSLGAQTVSSEIQYSKAKEAAEVGLNTAVRLIGQRIAASNTDACTITAAQNQSLTSSSSITYGYTSTKDSSGNNCFVYSIGKVKGTSVKVVKTTIIPVKITPANPGGTSAMRSGTVSNANFNGANTAIGNDCGGPGVLASSLPNTAKTNLEASNGSYGNPPVFVDPNLPNIYTSTFGPTITNRSTLNAFVDTVTATKMLDLTIAANCKVNPLKLPNVNCSTDKQGNNIRLSCSGGVSQTINLDSCPQVVINADSVNINHDTPTSTTFTANVTNNLNITSSIKGLLSSKNVLNINSSGNPNYEGIFLGADASNLNIAGNISLKGLYFIGNDNHNSNLTVDMSGNTSVLGSLVVDGNINNITRNGGGNAGGNDYNIEYDNNVINSWGAKYPGLLANFGCGGATGTPPSIASTLNKTKMTMF